MRIPISGQEGCLGSVLVLVLRTVGHEVTGPDTGLYTARLLGPPPPEVDTLRVDLRDVTTEHCMVDARYDPALDVALARDDPELAIAWPLPDEAILSDRDRSAPKLAEIRDHPPTWCGHHHAG
jgi:nucleoside-diphosphate-sugar epimerase